jgi:hypothetical protein
VTAALGRTAVSAEAARPITMFGPYLPFAYDDYLRHASATASIEREQLLRALLARPDWTATKLLRAFLRPPLYSRAYERGFGTLYTAVYRPQRGEIEYHWPGKSLTLSFAAFKEGTHRIRFPADAAPHEMPKA